MRPVNLDSYTPLPSPLKPVLPAAGREKLLQDPQDLTLLGSGQPGLESASPAGTRPTASKSDERPGYDPVEMGFLAGSPPPPPAPAGTVRDTYYHHVDWSGYSGKPPLQAGLSVLEGGQLRSGRGFHIDTWHGVLRDSPRPGNLTLVFSPGMPASQRARGIFERQVGSGVWLASDPHLEGVLYNGSSIPEELTRAVARLNDERGAFGLPAVDLLPWKMFHEAWERSGEC